MRILTTFLSFLFLFLFVFPVHAQEAQDGTCSHIEERCATGIYNYLPINTAEEYLWTCQGINGGADATCTQKKPISGNCGTSQNTCASGEYAPLTGDLHTQGFWECRGLYEGRDKLCKGIANKVQQEEDVQEFSFKCSLGSYACTKQKNGTLICTPQGHEKPIYPVDLPTDTTGVTTNVLSPGQPQEKENSNVGTRPSTDTSVPPFSQEDLAKKTGTVSTSMLACGITQNSCAMGAYSFLPYDTKDEYRWTCKGDRGTKITCTYPKSEARDSAIKGLCGLAKNSCIAGKYSFLPRDTQDEYRWTCKGKNGGQSENCHQPKDVYNRPVMPPVIGQPVGDENTTNNMWVIDPVCALDTIKREVRRLCTSGDYACLLKVNRETDLSMCRIAAPSFDPNPIIPVVGKKTLDTVCVHTVTATGEGDMSDCWID